MVPRSPWVRWGWVRWGWVLGLALGSLGAPWVVADEPPPAPPPIRALLVTGGPFHDYHKQTQILIDGMKTRGNFEWTVVNEEKKQTTAKLDLFDQPDWANGFDVVVHNECFADVDDPEYVARMVAAHRAGVPAVVVHCAMHTFRSLKSDEWREFLGVTTVRHGRQHPLVVQNAKPDHPIMKGFPATWTTGDEELYVIDKLWPDSVALATAAETNKLVYPVFWTHQYGKARVFGTTLAHNERTMLDPVFLDVFGRGLLWAAGRLDESGQPTPDAAPVPPSQN